NAAAAPVVADGHISGLQLTTALAASGSTTSTTESAVVRNLVTAQARGGKPVNAGTVKVATVPDPLQSGKEVTVAWTGDQPPADIAMQAVTAPNGSGAGAIGVKFGDETQAPPAQAPKADAPVTSGGSGYTAGLNAKNMYLYGNDCTTVFFNAAWAGGNRHQVITCYEKWAQSGTDHWVYNRWGLFTRATGGSVAAKTKEFTIRSRPWKGDPSVRKLNKWAPEGPSSTCTDRGNITLGGTYSGVTGQVAIPIRTCNTTLIKSDTSAKMIGIGQEGSDVGQQVRLDVAGDFNAKDKKVIPVWADYVWAEVTFGANPPHSQIINPKDSGW
ncbi:hypothetical protein ACWKSP_23825, partial [Micromonosporaceae bacterium Da 78-11]